MKNRHATDLDIQQFAFDQAEVESSMMKHISTCKECGEKVEAYVSLSAIIKDQAEPILDYDLSKLVLGQLVPGEELEADFGYLVKLMVVSLVVLSISMLFLFRETILFLLDNALIQQSYFMISIIIFVSAFLAFDQFRSFNEKLKMLNT